MKKYSLLVMAIAVLVSCSKRMDVQKANPDGLKNGTQFMNLKRYQYKPTVFNLMDNSTAQGVFNQKKQNTITFLRDSLWPNNAGKTSFYESTEIPAILPETRMKLYLGAILRGDQAVDVENFTPLRIPITDRNPITMYANFPTDSIYRTVMPSPIQDASYIRAALKAGTGTQVQSFTYEMNQFKKTEELKKSFGANLKVGNILDVSYLDTSAAGMQKTKVRAEFIQENFAVNIEPPIYEPFLKPTVDMGQFGGYDPLIVSSVTYGRKGIFIMESDSSYDMVRKTLSVALTLSAEMVSSLVAGDSSKLGNNFSITLGLRLTKEQRETIENSKVYVYVIGVDGKSTVQAVTGGLAGFAEVIAKSGGFSPESPGVPLYYTLNYLSDFGTFRNPFQVNVSN
ncbi:thiol-activated cytolysin family protein [Niabella beijingensis]|uniref:thiol-activated cytolysin family protein n=1 Tax=Niabella beijingensis TaxID=2872700 RepID=UPI001CBFCCA8|nr:thiol-activated cytolysin family protein [Niabella beijingensis]MBZ4189361.1 thiol-activated cytolysin family protein [Niabella beijingensis]